MYATATDISDLHGADFLLLVAARGDEASLSGPLTAGAISDALAQSSSEIDGYLRKRHAVPVTPVPAVLRNCAINMAVYHLASTADRMTEIIRERYKNAMALLHDLAAGRFDLPPGSDGQGGSLAAAAPELATITSNEPLFKRGGW